MHELSQSATLNAQPEQPCATKSQTAVGQNRLGSKVRTLAELLSAAMCRGDDEAAARYWSEYRSLRAGAGA